MKKYPRTLHFNFSPEIHADDKTIDYKDLGNFLDVEYIITEKMDGQNNCIKGLGNTQNGVFARTHSVQTQLPWDSYLKKFYHDNLMKFNHHTWYFIENLYAVHSIEYEKLNNYFFLFNLYKEKHEIFDSWDKVESEAKRLGFNVPEVLFRGKFKSMSEVQQWMDYEIKKPSKYGSKREGFVMRPADAFLAKDFQSVVGKYVRKGHVQTDEHWTKNWVKADLKT